MNKEELTKENQRLADRVSSLFNENDRLRKELEIYKNSLEESNNAKRDLEHDVYFLAGMLYKEGVNVVNYGRGLKIQVVEKIDKSDF